MNFSFLFHLAQTVNLSVKSRPFHDSVNPEEKKSALPKLKELVNDSRDGPLGFTES